MKIPVVEGQDLNPTSMDWFRFYAVDHQIVRVLWWNHAVVTPDLWRANQPGLRQLRRYSDMGLRSVVSLRGTSDDSYNRIERLGCLRAGLSFQHSPGLRARALVNAETMLRVVDDIAAAEKPVLIHCKSGADRTGLAAALYLILAEEVPVEAATRQLAPRFIHFHRSDSGVLSHLFRVYMRDVAPKGIDFRTWLVSDYQAEAIQEDFADWCHRRRRWA